MFQNVKRSQDELNKLFTIAGLEHFRRQEEATSTLPAMQSFVDQLTPIQLLWGPELLSLLGIEDGLIVECLEKQRDYLIETKQATKFSKVRLANEEIFSRFAQTTEDNQRAQTDSNDESRDDVKPLPDENFIDDVFPDLNQERNMRNDSVF